MRFASVSTVKRVRRRLATGLEYAAAFFVVAATALACLWDPVPMQLLRHAAFDQFQRWQPRHYDDAPVRIVDVDDESLERLGQWPWPRTRIAELVNRLHEAGAAAIVFDVVFSEPDRTSPAAIVELWQASPALTRALSPLPDHDLVLAQAIRGKPVVLGFASERQGRRPSLPTSKARFVSIGASPVPFAHAFAGSITSLSGLASAAAGHGTLSFVPDSDGIIRRVPLLVRHGSALLPSLSSEALRVAQDERNYVLRGATASQPGTGELVIGRYSIPTTERGEAWIHYSAPVARRYLSAWKVLAGQMPADEIAGKIALVGTSAQGLMDLRFAPVGGVVPGVEIHAQFLEQALAGTGLERPAWTRAAELLLVTAGGLLVAALAWLTRIGWSLTLFTGAIAAIFAGAWYGFASHRVLVDPVVPALTLALAFVSSIALRHGALERRQRWIRRAFSRYVSPNLLAHLAAHPEALELGGHRRHCSFVFTDLAGFTEQMERLDPGQAMGLLNTYLNRMITIAFDHGGTLDRIVGDAVAIMFSAPVAQPDHRSRALSCALAMHRFASDYVAELDSQGVRFCTTRIGVHSGEVVVGNFGGSAIFDYRALGDPVNTTSRLEAANKQLGTLVCVSAAIMAGCPNVAARPVGRVRLRGKSDLLEVFDPVGATTADQPDPEYEKAFALMRQGNDAALHAFERLAARRSGDPLVALHLRRLREGARDDLVEIG